MSASPVMAAELDMKRIIMESGLCIGYDSLKEKHVEAISVFLQGNDTFVVLPTGYGKSAIYAALPHAFDNIRGKFTGAVSV